MGLIRAALDRILAPWYAAEAMKEYHEGVATLLRSVLEVTRVQAETTNAMQATLQAIGEMYITTESPESWTNDEENAMLKEMLETWAQGEHGKGH